MSLRRRVKQHDSILSHEALQGTIFYHAAEIAVDRRFIHIGELVRHAMPDIICRRMRQLADTFLDYLPLLSISGCSFQFRRQSFPI